MIRPDSNAPHNYEFTIPDDSFKPGSSIWITILGHSLHIAWPSSGPTVSIYPQGEEDLDPISEFSIPKPNVAV